MPNFDAGHYFLTALLPIDNRSLVRDNGTLSSPVRIVRRALSVLPKAAQSPSTEAAALRYGLTSPFTRSLRTHFLRIVVIDDVIFNGRNPTNAIRVTLDEERLDPTIAGRSDQLRFPYLLLVADFDAQSGDPAELDSYLRELWEAMPRELTSVFQYCFKFDGVGSAQQFADFVKLGQIETTMPFNDYWEPAPDLKETAITPGIEQVLIKVGKGTLYAVAAAVALFLVRLLLVILEFVWPSGFLHRAAGNFGVAAAAVGFLALLGIACLVIAAFVLHRRVAAAAATPFPTGQRSDLRSILKALYLQQRFAEFAIASQGLSGDALHRAFAAFLHDHRPGDVAMPTQAPGVVRS